MADILLIDIKSGALPPGPGPEPQPQDGYRVRYFDGVNAEPIKTQYLETGDATPPPNPDPDPEYLIFDGWNNPSIDINSDRDIGAMYTTVDDATWAFLDVNHKTGKTVDFHFICEDGEITLDLGDGSNPIIASVDSGNNVKASHTYSDYGKYIVKITCSGSQGYTLGYGDNNTYFMGLRGQNTLIPSPSMQTLTKLYCASDVQIRNYFRYFYNLSVLILPRSLTSIGNYSIYNLYSLTSLVLPSNLTSIGSNSIYNLYSLTSLVLPNSITSIGSNSIYNLYSLTSLVLPNSITSIGSNSIYNLTSLTSLVLPNSITSIGDYSIYNLTSLTSLVLPSNLTSIGNYSISYLYSLTSLVLPSNLTSIGNYSISYLYSLTSLVLPNSITSIGSNSIRALSSLGTLIVESETPPTLQAPFTFIKYEGYLGIYVPDNSVDAYKNATNWSVFADFIYPMSYLE